MKLEPVGTLATSVRVGDVISLFATSLGRFLVSSVFFVKDSDGGERQSVNLLRMRRIQDEDYMLSNDAVETNIAITDKPIFSRTDHYTRVYVHGHFDTTKEMTLL